MFSLDKDLHGGRLTGNYAVVVVTVPPGPQFVISLPLAEFRHRFQQFRSCLRVNTFAAQYAIHSGWCRVGNGSCEITRIRIRDHQGGFEFAKKMPEVDELNFAPRVKVPTLLVGGRYDEFFPLETSQNVMFRFLGTPEKDKRHAVLEGGHIPPYDQLVKEILDWLDKYQGPVKMSSAVQPAIDRK